jgi:hypothetical protein
MEQRGLLWRFCLKYIYFCVFSRYFASLITELENAAPTELYDETDSEMSDVEADDDDLVSVVDAFYIYFQLFISEYMKDIAAIIIMQN